MREKNKLFLKALILFFIIVCIGGTVFYVKTYKDKTNKTSNVENIIEKEKKEEEQIIEDDKVDEKEEELEIEKESIDTSKNIESNSSNNNSVNNSDKKSNNVSNNATNYIPTNNETPKKVVEPVNEPPKEETKKTQTLWEELGISEYDYYNKPMWSWARIDFSVKEYKTFEQTHQACINAGDKLENILAYSCISVNSYSGDYLGDMLEVKY